MKQRMKAAGIAMLGAVAFMVEQVLAETWINSRVVLNDDDKGNFFFALTSHGKIMFMREELYLLGLKRIPVSNSVGKDGYISLAPHVMAIFDEHASVLSLTVSPELLERTVVDEIGSKLSSKDGGERLAQKIEMIVANVHLNDENKGDFFLQRNGHGEILFAKADVHRLGLQGPWGEASTTGDYVRLPADVTADLDEESLVFNLVAMPEQLDKSTIDLSRRRLGLDELLNANGTGFINYGVSYNADDELEFTSLSVPVEAGVTFNGLLGLTSLSYIKQEEDEHLVRLMTSIVKDLPAKKTRIIAGDYSASSGMLGSGGLYGGLSIGTKFSMDPYSLHYPGVNLYGAVNTPSDVEVYVNGLLVGKEHLSPGEFEFTNVGNVQGSGEATLILTDAHGQKERLTVPYYASSQLLKPGLHEYSYSLGYQREEYGVTSSEYGDAAFLGTHRIGLTRTLTAGLRAEGDKDITNGGVSAAFILGSLGEFNASYASSVEGEVTGNAWSVRYSRAGKYMSGSLFSRSYSRDYANLMTGGADDKPRFEGSANVGFYQKRLGSLSFFYTKKDMYEEMDSERYGINYNRRLLPDVSLNIVAARTEAEDTTDEVYANLMILLGKSRSANVSSQKKGSHTTVMASLQKNAPLGTGYGYRLSAEYSENEWDQTVNGGNAYLQYRGHHGIYSAEGRTVDGINNYTVGTTGGIALANGAAYFTRPIYDGFALAKVGTLENVEVKYNNQEIGVTDENGEVLIPSLISYHRNSISINDNDIPVNYQLAEVDRSVTVPYRGGGVVDFKVEKLQAFIGKLKLAENGKHRSAEYWGLKLGGGSQEQTFIVGKGGEIYLENLVAGDYPARLFKGDEGCSFEITIPESDAMMVDLGEVTCEKN